MTLLFCLSEAQVNCSSWISLLHNHMNQLLIVSLCLSPYISYWFCFSGEPRKCTRYCQITLQSRIIQIFKSICTRILIFLHPHWHLGLRLCEIFVLPF